MYLKDSNVYFKGIQQNLIDAGVIPKPTPLDPVPSAPILSTTGFTVLGLAIIAGIMLNQPQRRK